MKRILILLALQSFATAKVHCQSFTVSDLITLSSLPSKNIDHFMNKDGYASYCSQVDSAVSQVSFSLKEKYSSKYVGPKRSIDISIRNDSKYFTLHTTSLNEYREGEQSLIKAGFFYDEKKDINSEGSMLFQKANITIYATTTTHDGVPEYTFMLKLKKIPTNIMYAEDLLQFDSHEFLVSFLASKM